MLKNLLGLNNLGGEFKRLFDAVRRGQSSAVFGVSLNEKCHLAGSLDLPVLYIAKDGIYAAKAAEQLSDITGRRAVLLPPKDDVLLFKKAVSKDSLFKRLEALYRIKRGAKYVVTTMEALLQLLPSDIEILELKKGEFIQEEIVSRLIKMGYDRCESVEYKGTFTVRGDIIDVFPVNSDNPYRINFFGDEIENIKQFDATSRQSCGYADSLDIAAATDIIIEPDDVPEIIETLNSEYNALSSEKQRVRGAEIVGDLTETLRSGSLEGLSFIMPLLRTATSDILGLMGGDTVVVFDECKMLADSAEICLKEFYDRYANLKEGGEVFSFSAYQMADKDELIYNLTKSRSLALQNITTDVRFFKPQAVFSIKSTPVARYSMRMSALAGDIKSWKISGYRVVLAAGDDKRADSLKELLEEQGVYVTKVRNVETDFAGAVVTPEKLSGGFIYHELKLAVIGTGDLYTKQDNGAKRIKRRRNDMFTAPEIGDYAVHEVHGIGLVKGTKKITTADGTKDYIMLEYSGGDLLYVPVEQMDILSRYLGAEARPPLNKLGGKDFAKVKERVRTSIKAMAFDLKQLYRDRFTRQGFKFSPDNEISAEFDRAFPFEETEDQLQSIAEIKKDMESGKVMDRLLCGDVGYGKTEVAFRAAFKAILDGKQVALLAPTTILSQQHYNTAIERFKNFGIRIQVLNRFKTEAQQRKIIEELKEGTIDFIIGTHRLLGKDVLFKDLGLLILDEEQRFGVEHKERIKLMKTNVDTLTMTATPIPRTLHMSLSGIRDISTIETPIKERLPVQVYVVEETEALIRDAVIRELSREGQAFILYNRVSSIHGFANKIAGIIPEAKITVAHGQMDERALEDSIMEFFSGRSNVLISTTIIENGIDLPNANTIIVIDSDRLGLSQLYQLKGRVGRSSRLAHAYFTFKRDKVLSETAYKRLSAIMEFTQMNSGFKIAMRDLEIRGAGNVLGREQHGHMDRIGYELYAKLIREEMTGEKYTGDNMSLDIRLSAYIPEDYIESSSGRLDAYKQIAEINGEDDMARVKNSLEDLYGTVTKEVENLIKIAGIKSLAAGLGTTEIRIKKGETALVLESVDSLNNSALMDAIDLYKDKTAITFDKSPLINFRLKGADNESAADEMFAFLKTVQSFTQIDKKKLKKIDL